jgi:hypothetical protein
MILEGADLALVEYNRIGLKKYNLLDPDTSEARKFDEVAWVVGRTEALREPGRSIGGIEAS